MKYLAFLAVLLALLPSLTGCGAGGTSDAYPGADSPTKPVAASQDSYRPNYCGDLSGMYYFEQETITYRILGDQGATAINMAPIISQEATAVQAQDIHDAFRKIETALEGRRQFVEVAASDASAAIDVVVQDESAFGDVGENGIALGRCDLWYPGGKYTPIIRRAVVRLMADQPERSFRRTALHESIHAVGLWGHSRHYSVMPGNLGDILVPVSLPLISEIELSRYDINTLRANYER